MKKIWKCVFEFSVLLVFSISLAGISTRCNHYPANPDIVQAPEPKVVIRHVQTDYIPVSETDSDLIANKINVLTFQITPQNMDCKALEFCGRAVLFGPPSQQEHVLHFRTDKAINHTEDIPVQPNIVDRIQSGSTITLFRIKYPTNEYAPFEGDQGKIQSLEILDAWSIDEDEARTPVQVLLETE